MYQTEPTLRMNPSRRNLKTPKSDPYQLNLKKRSDPKINPEAGQNFQNEDSASRFTKTKFDLRYTEGRSDAQIAKLRSQVGLGSPLTDEHGRVWFIQSHVDEPCKCPEPKSQKLFFKAEKRNLGNKVSSIRFHTAKL